MSDINYSIIIPHRNIPALLQRCINSIPRREDVQIIVVDDNSSPDIVDFDNFPGKKDEKNVEIYYTKAGGGAGFARNVGLSHAKGKWLLFADADDFFSENINCFLDEYKDSAVDVIYLLNKTIDMETGKELHIDEVVSSLCKECINGDFEVLRYKCYPPWTKMVSRELVVNNKIKFDEVSASNDVAFSVFTGYYLKTMALCPYYVYVRNVRQGSLQYSVKKEILLSRINVGYSINRFLSSIGKLDYYVDILGHIWSLRKVSIALFFYQLCLFLYKSPNRILCDSFKRVINRLRK